MKKVYCDICDKDVTHGDYFSVLVKNGSIPTTNGETALRSKMDCCSTCIESMTLYTDDNYRKLRDEAEKHHIQISKDRVLSVIEDEAVLEGDMPDSLWDKMNGNKHNCIDAMRAVVQTTKNNLIKAVDEII